MQNGFRKNRELQHNYSFSFLARGPNRAALRNRRVPGRLKRRDSSGKQSLYVVYEFLGSPRSCVDLIAD